MDDKKNHSAQHALTCTRAHFDVMKILLQSDHAHTRQKGNKKIVPRVWSFANDLLGKITSFLHGRDFHD
jgi:hypothetical protein